MNGNLAYKLEPKEEIIDGKVVMMATPVSNHIRVSRNISSIFDNYFQDGKCEYFPDRGGLYLEDDTEEYQPDGMVVCDPDKVKWDGVHGAPDLVIEILSPSTAQYDRGHKKDIYERHGIREYWIVDPANRMVEQYVLEEGRYTLRGIYSHYPDFMLQRMKPEEKAALVTEFKTSLFDDLTIPLDRVFRHVIPRL